MKSDNIHKKMVRRILLFVLLCPFVLHNSPLFAQSEYFVPAGVFSIEQAFAYSSADHGFSRADQSTTFLDLERQRARLDTGQVAGKIAQQKAEYRLGLRYGAAENWNLSGGLLWQDKQRTADLQNISGSADATNFIEGIKTESVSGLHYAFLQGRYRVFFDDELDWILSAAMLYSPTGIDLNKSTRLRASLGHHGIELYSRWIGYSLESDNHWQLTLGGVAYLDAESKNNPKGSTATIVSTGDRFARFEYNWAFADSFLGMGLHVEHKGQISAVGDTIPIRQSTNAYLLQMHGELNNLLDFRSSDTQPYIMRALIARSISGLNVPVENRISLELTLFF